MMSGNEKMTPDEKRAQIRRPKYDEMREIKDPCVREHEMTMKCLDDNGYERDKCKQYFTNYKFCRTFWSRVAADRKKKGIEPNMPLPSDREAIKKEYEHIIS